jgi:DNA-directed RNA polymerase
MEHKWGSYMGRKIYDDCRLSLKRPMQLLDVFENAGQKAETDGRFLSWTVPITNFPVVQNYTVGIVKKVWVQYGPPKGKLLTTNYYKNTYQLNICYIEETIPARHKQSQGAAPNAIHSLDAAHLMLIVDRCKCDVTTVHDSFGCLLSDMDELFRVTRETFVELYKEDPLLSLMKDIDGDLTNVEIGALDINLVLQSEYCFS